MILAFQSIFTAYGFWLPNEERGSWSEFVASWELLRYGPATKVTTRQSVAHGNYDRERKREMQSVLNHAPSLFTGEQARIIGQSFRNTPYVIHALAVMTDHVHAVIAHTPRHIRRMVGHMKSKATRALREAGYFVDRPVWAEHGWNVFLDSDADVERAVPYVEENPMKEGLPRQRWKCVVPYDASCSRLAQARRERRG